ncbi:uncharacterized protein SAPINGB_P005613 [Magnusiomyces paraingens]|uniref:GH16 domain-containing protein n=1 Tax=Magnusiomyces paraingens TaxID=2606893 RepID=A0A5E8C0M3_9ASCO|nr:uncharacterized protein SAPINGB_P005613 [Saprochaete ingens]VVT57257.1 unnamed protein product [Saprochaete ingens]
MFGHVEIVAKAAPGVGIVSSSVLISDNLDELDWEWLGKDINEVQTNYFSKGDDSTFNRGGISQVSDTQNQWHTYSIDWTASSTTWSVDGQVVRTLDNPNTGYYPQTPMQIKIGPWSAGDPSNREGTIEWAGGETDYSQGPFTFSVKSISVQDYSTGTAYSYSDHSGSWSSIQAANGVIRTQSEDSTNEEVYAQQVEQNEAKTEASTQLTPVVYVYTTIIQAATQTSQTTSSAIATSSSGHSSYDNGQYHPNPKYDDGSYKPDLYMVKKSYVSTNSSQSSVVEQSNSGTTLPMSKELFLVLLALLIAII